jgi:hypothetical protein
VLEKLLRVGAVAIGLGSIGVLGGCGSSANSGAETASSASPATCQMVSAVLSDGPDPGADPVGYAEAQIIQLRQIHTTDRRLQLAVDRLASAYVAFFKSNGKAAGATVSRAAASVDALCPGADAGV